MAPPAARLARGAEVHPGELGGPARPEAAPPLVAAHPAPAAPAPPPAPPRPQVDPLTADLSRLHVTVGRAFLAKLAAARDGASHASAGASAEAILEAGLDLLLERQAARRGLTKQPRPTRSGPVASGPSPTPADPPPAASPEPSSCASPPGPPGRGGIPAQVRREVWRRDDGRCQWPLASGGVCGATHRLELDHLIPAARGGPPTVANLRILCRAHNQLAARLAFGAAWMGRFGRRAGGGAPAPTCGTAPGTG
jgi:hypothetical protein